jgi:2,5-diketo-D-gluconate reductase A
LGATTWTSTWSTGRSLHSTNTWSLTHPTVSGVAEALGRTPAQVLIRRHIQLGNIVIPKSVNPARIASNYEVFDFELSPDEMTSISSLDDGARIGPNPRTLNFTGR